jgi:hypothetical protein
VTEVAPLGAVVPESTLVVFAGIRSRRISGPMSSRIPWQPVSAAMRIPRCCHSLSLSVPRLVSVVFVGVGKDTFQDQYFIGADETKSGAGFVFIGVDNEGIRARGSSISMRGSV